jgi:5-methylcytosine-specific restriction enzyme B
MDNTQYWALGFGSGEYYTRLDRFKKENYWQAFDYEESDNRNIAQRARKYFDQIKNGDQVLIKGFGGSHDLIVHYVGIVKEIIKPERKLLLEPKEVPLYRGKAPSGHGAGNWHETIVKVNRSNDINRLFNGIENELTNSSIQEETTNSMNTSLNQILYGPPGTGKTYHTINKAIKLVDPAYNFSNKTRREIADHFRSLLYDEEKNPNGQILFTTFHQSLSYEDFIEGIKPKAPEELEDQVTDSEGSQSQLDFIVKDGIFKEIVSLAKKSTKSTLAFDELWQKYLQELKQNSTNKTFTSISSELKLDSIEPNGNSINVRFKKSWNPEEPEGTRAFIVSRNMIERLFDAKVDGSESNKKGRTDVKKLVGSGRATHIYSVYKDFYQYADRIGAFSKGQLLNYVLIIDEINRGNVSAIFGELITLIESDKRIGEENELSVVLSYSRDRFSIPSNLYIIGTMNTADRSVEALDTALRRRFSFTEMLPQPELLSPSAMICRLFWEHKNLDWTEEPYKSEEEELFEFLGIPGELHDEKQKIWDQMKAENDQSKLDYFVGFESKCSGINLKNLLTVINERIEILLDREHTMGHSYFINVYSIDQLRSVFRDSIIPLLQEYFYGHYDKIELVIGSAFIDRKDANEVRFAAVNSEMNRMNQIVKISIPQGNDEFEEAIQTLIEGVQ